MKKQILKLHSKKLIALFVFAALLLLGLAAYSLINVGQTARCDNNKCFQEKFVKCEKAKFQAGPAFESGEAPIYEILSGGTENCKVSEKFASDNKETICTIQFTDSWNDGTEDSFYRAIGLAKASSLGKVKACTDS